MTSTDFHQPGHSEYDVQEQNAELVVDREQWATLRALAETFNDIQQARIGVENRLNHAPIALIEGDDIEVVLKDGKLVAQHKGMRDQEHRSKLALRRQYRKTVPAGIREWEKVSTGIGIDLLARLLGHMGHPRAAFPYHWEGKGSKRVLVADLPFERSRSQLRQYAGHGRPGRAQAGATAEELFALGRPALKMLVHLLAESTIKEPGRTVPQQAIDEPPSTRATPAGDFLHPDQRRDDSQARNVGVDLSATPPTHETTTIEEAAVWPYRKVYEARRIDTLNRDHNEPCVRCGPSGHPAPVGSPWNAGHQHADALRIVGKAILDDLWAVSE